MVKAQQIEPGPELDVRIAEIIGGQLGKSIHTNGNSVFFNHGPVGCFHPSRGDHSSAVLIKSFLQNHDPPIHFKVEFDTDGTVKVYRDYRPRPMAVHAGSEPLSLCRFLIKLDEEGVLDA